MTLPRFARLLATAACLTAAGCTKRPLPLPPPAADALARPLVLEPATSAGAAGPLIYRGVLGGATAHDKPPRCPQLGAPYIELEDNIVLGSALTPFVRFDVSGYVRSCLDHTVVKRREGDTWREVNHRLSQQGSYVLDGTSVGFAMCDLVSCMKIDHPICVPLVEYEALALRDASVTADAGAPTVPPADGTRYRSRPLTGEVQIAFPFYDDDHCKKQRLTDHVVRL